MITIRIKSIFTFKWVLNPKLFCYLMSTWWKAPLVPHRICSHQRNTTQASTNPKKGFSSSKTNVVGKLRCVIIHSGSFGEIRIMIRIRALLFGGLTFFPKPFVEEITGQELTVASTYKRKGKKQPKSSSNK